MGGRLVANLLTLVPCFVLWRKLSHNIKPFPLMTFLSHLFFLCWVRSREPVSKSGSAFTFQVVKKVKNSNKEKLNILCCDFIWESFELYFLLPTTPCQAKDLAKVHLQNCLQIANAHIRLHSTGRVPTFDIKLRSQDWEKLWNIVQCREEGCIGNDAMCTPRRQL